MPKIIAGVEIGTAKSAVLVGEVRGHSLNILGYSTHATNGLKKGDIVDFRTASEAAHAAIIQAEKQAEVSIEEVYLAVSGSHLEGFASRGPVNVSAADNLVSPHDIKRATDAAKSKRLPEGRVYLAYINSGWRLDGRMVENPLGQRGEALEVTYWNVHADEKRLGDALRLVNGISLPVTDCILSSVASACMVASDDDKRHGCLVCDWGAGTLDYALYRSGLLLRTGVIPVGGHHLTNDLTLGLRVPGKFAESLKLTYGRAQSDPTTKGDTVWMVGDKSVGDRRLPRLAMDQILGARVEETLQILKRQLGDLLNPQDTASGVIWTGGAARLADLCELTRRTLGVEARLGQNPTWVREDLRGPEFSTVLGLLYYGLTAQQPEEAHPKQRRPGLLHKVAKMLNFA